MDPVAARRLLFGSPVVHGVHLVAWSLEEHLACGGQTPTGISARFRQPVFLNEEVLLQRVDRADITRLALSIAGSTLSEIELTYGTEGPGAAREPDPAPLSQPSSPRTWTPGALETAHGRLAVQVADRFRRDHLPHLTAALGAEAVDQLLSLSRLVGMECPGDRSLFSGLDVSLGSSTPTAGLTWEVERFHAGLGAVRLTVAATHLAGSVTAFVRPASVAQPLLAQVRTLIDPEEFSGTQWVVIGGTRGLGEVAAKLLAAGGATTTLTWNQGQADAERVATEVRDAGGSVRTVPLRLRDGRVDNLEPMLAGLDRPIDGLLYLASPRIASRRLLRFDRAAFGRFLDVYLDGFVALLDQLGRHGRAPRVAVWPSTTFVEDPPADLIEYALAKQVAEVAIGIEAVGWNGTAVIMERLPPLLTDQTSGRRGAVQDPAPATLQLLRRACVALQRPQGDDATPS